MDEGPKTEVSTRFGPVWLWGTPTGRPTLLVVTGLGASVTMMEHFPRVFPDLDVLRTHMPGNHCPDLQDGSIRTWADALTEALRVVRGPLAILGSSLGALPAMGVRHPALVGLLLIDPPLEPKAVWPLPQLAVYEAPPLAFAAPTEVLAGSVPLEPPRVLKALPSLVPIACREALASLATLTVVEGAGHNLKAEALEEYAAATYRLVDRLKPPAQ